ncbi:MAG: hypothetical protein N3A00_04590, partial [Thermodesulfovibrio sp.]|nr:hypothetical protein [Thermodesulfovibrio sp.]
LWEDAFRKPKIISLYNLYETGLKSGVHVINISNATVLPELSDYFVVVVGNKTSLRRDCDGLFNSINS